MNSVRSLGSLGLVVATALLVATWLSAESRAQATDRPALAGAWTLNRDLSDQSMDSEPDGGDRGRPGGFPRGGGGRGGGGFGGYRRRGGGGPMGGPMATDPQEMARVRDAMRDIMSPPAHLTIVQTESMVLITGPDGRTTRLSPDGKKIKDENTRVERKTKWDGGRLVSEIDIAGSPRKMTQTFAVDQEHHQLRITVQAEGGRDGQPRSILRVYDADAR